MNGDGTVNDSEADTVTEHDQSYTTEDAVDEVLGRFLLLHRFLTRTHQEMR